MGIPERIYPARNKTKLLNIDMRWIMNDWIVVDSKICAGKPTIRGTRIMVKNILGMIAGGYALDQVLQAYPELTREMVDAALQYAVTVIDEEKVLSHA